MDASQDTAGQGSDLCFKHRFAPELGVGKTIGFEHHFGRVSSFFRKDLELFTNLSMLWLTLSSESDGELFSYFPAFSICSIFRVETIWSDGKVV